MWAHNDDPPQVKYPFNETLDPWRAPEARRQQHSRMFETGAFSKIFNYVFSRRR